MGRLEHIPGDFRVAVPVGSTTAFSGFVFSAPFACKLTAYVATTATVASNSSNYETITFVNAGTTGTGTVSLGSLATNAVSLDANTPVAVFTEKSLGDNELVKLTISGSGTGATLTGFSIIFVYESV